MSTGKVILGVLAGLAAGTTIGLLLAPDKGSKTRKKIARKGEDYMEELEEKFNGIVDGMSKKFENMKAEATRIKENGKAKVEAVLAKDADKGK